jgi:hypothetical protein
MTTSWVFIAPMLTLFLLARLNRPLPLRAVVGLPLLVAVTFSATLTDKGNPWQTLRTTGDEVPVIGEQNTVTWMLKSGLGNTLKVPDWQGHQVELRISGLLHDSVFQNGLLLSEKRFLELYPDSQGHSFFLIRAEPEKAKEMFQQGMLGDVHYVRAFWYRNSAENNPAWRYAIPPDANEQNSDWEKFLGPAPKRPFDLRRYYQWRLYWDYSGGISTDLLVHQTDIVNFVLGKTVPTSCMASGGIYRWTDKDDDRDVPDTLSAIYDYPDRFHINYSCYFGNDQYGYGEQFCGTEGTLEVLNRQDLHFYPQLLKGAAPEKVKARMEVHLNGPKDFGESHGVINHIRNFIESVRGNEKVIAPPAVGQQAAISGHMATLSLKNNKKVYWDSETGKIRYA